MTEDCLFDVVFQKAISNLCVCVHHLFLVSVVDVSGVGGKDIVAFYANATHPSEVGGPTKSAKSWGALLVHMKTVHGEKVLGQRLATQYQQEKRHANPKPKGSWSKKAKISRDAGVVKFEEDATADVGSLNSPP